LKDLSKKLDARVCLEAISGEMTGKIINQMPPNSNVILYGGLSEQDVSHIKPAALLGKGIRLEGFMLGSHMAKLSLWGLWGLVSKCQKMLSSGELKSEVYKRISLEDIPKSIPEYKSNMTRGKYVVYPHGVPE
jgi:NADPH2:quinone reductase